MERTFICALFGHRDFVANARDEERLVSVMEKLAEEHGAVEFLVGNHGEFDRFVASCYQILRTKPCANAVKLKLVLPYMTAEYQHNKAGLLQIYDEVLICTASAAAHYKAAIPIRNQLLAEAADTVICYIRRRSGGAYKAVLHAYERGTSIINLAKE